jgi:hypothetical protein
LYQACDLPLYLKAPLFFCAVAQGCQVPVSDLDVKASNKDGVSKSGVQPVNGQTTASSSADVGVGKKEFIDFWRRFAAHSSLILTNSSK